jgi:tetratricopeptide (TPR) repeat protein
MPNFSQNFSIRTPFQLLLIALVALTVFYPSLFAEFCRVDDVQMIAGFEQIKQVSIKDLFLPGASGGLYYRPFIVLSFLIDRFAFNLNSIAMHLHNVVLHLLNGVLLFFIARRVLELLALDYLWVPLITALLYVTHPITTESVCWISGRTDILAGNFVFAATNAILLYRIKRSRQYLYLAVFCFICGVLTKEFSLAFLPGFIWLGVGRFSQRENESAYRLRDVAAITLIGILCIAIFFLLRKMAFSSNYATINSTLLIFFNTPERSLQIILTALGFYLKKLYLPLPLCFTIFEVNALYEIVAWPLLAICCYIAWKRTLLSALFISGLLMITPAFIIAFHQIAWTAYAERYLYMPSAFVTLSTLIYFRRHLAFPHPYLRTGVVIILLAMAGGATMHRSWIWQTNQRLIEDTVLKEPSCRIMQLVLADILIGQKEFAKAEEHIVAASSVLGGIGYDEISDIKRVDLLMEQGKTDEAIAVCEHVLKKTNNTSETALRGLIMLYEKKDKAESEKSNRYREKIYVARKKLFRISRNASMLYDLGNDALVLGEMKKAKVYYTLATGNIPLKDPLYQKSVQALKRLSEVE